MGVVGAVAASCYRGSTRIIVAVKLVGTACERESVTMARSALRTVRIIAVSAYRVAAVGVST